MLTSVTTYGPGGFDPSRPNNNIVSFEEVETDDPPATIEDRIADVESVLAVLAAEALDV